MRKSIVCTLVARLILSATPYTVAADSNEDIPTNAAATGVHNTLVQALAHVDLVSTLEGTVRLQCSLRPTRRSLMQELIWTISTTTPQIPP